jgi:hypothetical protein
LIWFIGYNIFNWWCWGWWFFGVVCQIFWEFNLWVFLRIILLVMFDVNNLLILMWTVIFWLYYWGDYMLVCFL